jgi:hypothetical protein
METQEIFEPFLSRLVFQERALDHQIDVLTSLPLYDQLAVQRLKRLRVNVMNQIKKIKSNVLPDIIA